MSSVLLIQKFTIVEVIERKGVRAAGIKPWHTEVGRAADCRGIGNTGN